MTYVLAKRPSHGQVAWTFSCTTYRIALPWKYKRWASRHDLDPRDVRESLLYVRSNIAVYCTAPCGGGKEQRQQIARKQVENLWVLLRQRLATGDQKGEGHTMWDRDFQDLPY